MRGQLLVGVLLLGAALPGVARGQVVQEIIALETTTAPYLEGYPQAVTIQCRDGTNVDIAGEVNYALSIETGTGAPSGSSAVFVDATGSTILGTTLSGTTDLTTGGDTVYVMGSAGDGTDVDVVITFTAADEAGTAIPTQTGLTLPVTKMIPEKTKTEVYVDVSSSRPCLTAGDGAVLRVVLRDSAGQVARGNYLFSVWGEDLVTFGSSQQVTVTEGGGSDPGFEVRVRTEVCDTDLFFQLDAGNTNVASPTINIPCQPPVLSESEINWSSGTHPIGDTVTSVTIFPKNACGGRFPTHSASLVALNGFGVSIGPNTTIMDADVSNQLTFGEAYFEMDATEVGKPQLVLEITTPLQTLSLDLEGQVVEFVDEGGTTGSDYLTGKFNFGPDSRYVIGRQDRVNFDYNFSDPRRPDHLELALTGDHVAILGASRGTWDSDRRILTLTELPSPGESAGSIEFTIVPNAPMATLGVDWLATTQDGSLDESGGIAPVTLTTEPRGLYEPYGCGAAGGSGALAGLLVLGLLAALVRRRRLAGLALCLVLLPGLASAQDEEDRRLALAFNGVQSSTGLDDGTARALGDFLQSTLDERGVYRVMGVSEIEALLGLEQKKQLLGCSEDTSCLQEIAGALGADRLLFGTLEKLGDSMVINLSLIDVVGARVIIRRGRRVKDGGSVDAVLDVIPELVDIVIEADTEARSRVGKDPVAAAGTESPPVEPVEAGEVDGPGDAAASGRGFSFSADLHGLLSSTGRFKPVPSVRLAVGWSGVELGLRAVIVPTFNPSAQIEPAHSVVSHVTLGYRRVFGRWSPHAEAGLVIAAPDSGLHLAAGADYDLGGGFRVGGFLAFEQLLSYDDALFLPRSVILGVGVGYAL